MHKAGHKGIEYKNVQRGIHLVSHGQFSQQKGIILDAIHHSSVP